ncbi:hypothetical protein CEXT_515961 [Caerostris extrusa]|uniref:Ycf15 n=1 Tax=Caerostris extrusa TaxID=172846 RepID=A0AAV4UTW9_CAEEX|nr:hypothetical protein CEXT_515961 [Caerostris extrusa]
MDIFPRDNPESENYLYLAWQEKWTLKRRFIFLYDKKCSKDILYEKEKHFAPMELTRSLIFLHKTDSVQNSARKQSHHDLRGK